jgi:hypothetical protein
MIEKIKHKHALQQVWREGSAMGIGDHPASAMAWVFWPEMGLN